MIREGEDGTTSGTWKTKGGDGLKMINRIGTKVPIVWDWLVDNGSIWSYSHWGEC